MDLASEDAQSRVWFNGGTFSAHPLSLQAGQLMLEHLIAHEDEIYPALAARGERLRQGVEQVFAERGILARCSGQGRGAVPGSSLSSIYFPLREDVEACSAEDLADPALCDMVLQEQVLKLGLLLQDVHVMHGLGALSTAHSDAELERVFEACDAVAHRIQAGR